MTFLLSETIKGPEHHIEKVVIKDLSKLIFKVDTPLRQSITRRKSTPCLCTRMDSSNDYIAMCAEPGLTMEAKELERGQFGEEQGEGSSRTLAKCARWS